MGLWDDIKRFAAAKPAPTPRTLQTGTSMQSQGAIPVEKGAESELGSSTPVALRDPVAALGSRTNALSTYAKMANSDVAVDVSLRAGKTPVLGATWFVQPASEDKEDIDIADFIRYNLLEGQSAPFLNVLEDILRMYENGFSVLEAVYEQREWVSSRKGANRRNYTMLKKLAPRPANTIKGFTYDKNGGPVSIEQLAIDPTTGKTTEISIPITKAIVFTLNKQGGNLEGKSMLRTSYRHWYYKDHFYKIDAIQKERHAVGVPFIQLPMGYTADDKAAALQLVTNVRANEEAGFVIPPGYEMGFKKPEGELVNVLASIEHHNGMIMMNVMVQFLLMGIQEAGGGGRATSSSQQDMYVKSLRYIANTISQYINLYLIPRLVAYNFVTDKFPTLQVRNIGETKDLQMWASAMANLISTQAITVDKETEQWIRQQIDAPNLLGERPTTDGTTPTDTTGKGGVNPNDASKGQGNLPKGTNPQ